MDNRARSMNAEVLEGMTDGTYKKMPPNTAAVDPTEDAERRLFLWTYGFEQAPFMITGDGRKITPNPIDSGWRNSDPRGPRELRG